MLMRRSVDLTVEPTELVSDAELFPFLKLPAAVDALSLQEEKKK